MSWCVLYTCACVGGMTTKGFGDHELTAACCLVQMTEEVQQQLSQVLQYLDAKEHRASKQ